MITLNRIVILAISLISIAYLAPYDVKAEIAVLSPQPNPTQLSAGLAVTYYYDSYRHIDHLVSKMEEGPAVEGEPLPALNYRVGTDTVLSADRNDGVGAHIHGLIRLEEVGMYLFALESNDGVRLNIGGEMLIEDPDVHADRWSSVATVEITEPGWYALVVLYFENKNTSTLRLVWKTPEIGEAGKFAPVPQENYAHISSE